MVDIIEIEATPKSNDVVGLQDLYLQLDTSSSFFETVDDQISSGLDPSASTYTVTSSYPNGNLVRSGGPVTIGVTSPTTTTTTGRTAGGTTTTSTSSSSGTTTYSSSSSSSSSGSSSILIRFIRILR